MSESFPGRGTGVPSLAWCNSGFDPAKFPQSVEKAFGLAQKALAPDDTHARTHSLLRNIHSLKKEHDEAVAEAERGGPRSRSGDFSQSWLCGQVRRGDTFSRESIRLSPFAPHGIRQRSQPIRETTPRCSRLCRPSPRAGADVQSCRNAMVKLVPRPTRYSG